MKQQDQQQIKEYDYAEQVHKHLGILVIFQNPKINCFLICHDFQYQPQRTQFNKTYKTCTIREMKLHTINQGLELQGMIIIPRVKLESNFAMIMDDNNQIISIAISNMDQRLAMNNLGLAQRIGIINPKFILKDNIMKVVQVDNPQDIIPYEVDHNKYESKLEMLKKFCQHNQQASEYLKIYKEKLIIITNEQLKKNPKEICVIQHLNSEELSQFQNASPKYFKLFIHSKIMEEYSFEEAIKMYQNGIQSNRNYACLYLSLGELLFRLRDYQGCVMFSQQGLALYQYKNLQNCKSFGNILYMIAESLRILQDFKQSETYFIQAHNHDKQNPLYIDKLSFLYHEIKNYQQATVYLKKLVKYCDQYNYHNEQQRCYLQLLDLFYTMKDIKNLVEISQEFVQLDERNYFMIYEDLQYYINNDYFTFDEKIQLLNFLTNTTFFDVICEDLCQILIQQSKGTEQKKLAYQLYQKLALEAQSDESDNIYQEFSKLEKIDQIIDKNQATQQQIQQQEPKIAENQTRSNQIPQQDPNITKNDVQIPIQIQEEKEKKKIKKTPFKDIKQKTEQIKTETNQYKGFIGKIEFSSTLAYIVLFDLSLKFDSSQQRNKYIQASLKWSKGNLSQSGIKYIQEANIYEVKVCGKNGINGKRLICEKPLIESGKVILNFDQLLSHKEADRRILNKKK